ncbi:MAG: adenylate/guanylate cyclase domain-containing protein [Candidatus Pacearchaeota archaeon]|nr:adenylate/guanylate cyclase domain-containing protein [Candidatus Pacearchaeota archaeon]
MIGILNKILSLQAGFIKKYNGYIDKFVGDETMAVFKNTSDAINCAIHIQYNILKSPADFDHLKLGIGIYEGSVVEGDVGSEDTKDFTMIGDTVNTASRLQALALGGEIIVPEFIITSGEVKTHFKFKLKGNIKLKGKENEIVLYKITGTQG